MDYADKLDFMDDDCDIQGFYIEDCDECMQGAPYDFCCKNMCGEMSVCSTCQYKDRGSR